MPPGRRSGDTPTSSATPRDYLSPFYSPCIISSCPTEVVWGPVGNIGAVSPALLVLIFPLGFRLTCYYYRKTYYRSFWASPPACTVPDAGSAKPGGRRSRYTGETRFPLILQNVHRYSGTSPSSSPACSPGMRSTAFRFPDGIGMGLGTLIFVVNAVLIWATRSAVTPAATSAAAAPNASPKRRCATGCGRHRHAVSTHATSSSPGCPVLDRLHRLYVWLVASGTFHDPRFF